MDKGRSTGGYISFSQGGPTDYGSHLPVPVAMSSGEAEYTYQIGRASCRERVC